MRTNLEKWNHHMSISDKKDSEFISSLNLVIPKCVYEVKGNGTIQKMDITKVYYSKRNTKPCFYGEKPTKIQLSKLIEYVNSDIKYSKEFVFYSYQYFTKWDYKGEIRNSKTTGAFNLSEIEKYHIDINSANKDSKKKKEIKERENELLANGHIRCPYCNIVIPESEAVSHTIIFQNSRQDPFSRTGYKKFVDKKTNKYCSGECGGNDQMAHEG